MGFISSFLRFLFWSFIFAVSPVSSAQVSNAPAPSGKLASSFAAAAQQNAILRNDLDWFYGHGPKPERLPVPQRGWRVYTRLIQKLLRTSARNDSPEFAAALAAWQASAKLSPDGILDEKTLMAMIGLWQARRAPWRIPKVGPLHGCLKSVAGQPAPDGCSGIPESFRHPTVSSSFIATPTLRAYEKLIASYRKSRIPGSLIAEDSETYLTVRSAYRSVSDQGQVQAANHGKSSGAVASKSVHTDGRAVDLYVGGDPISSELANREIQVETSAYRYLLDHACEFGFVPYFYEPWHWEYVGKPGLPPPNVCPAGTGGPAPPNR